MAYDTAELFKQAKEAILEHKLFFIEDIVAFIPCSKPTFYTHFPIDSNEFNDLKDMLDVNKVTLKVSMRKKWWKSDNPALQMGLMRLICTEDEREKLSMNYSRVTTNVDPTMEMTEQEREDRIAELLLKAQQKD